MFVDGGRTTLLLFGRADCVECALGVALADALGAAEGVATATALAEGATVTLAGIDGG